MTIQQLGIDIAFAEIALAILLIAVWVLLDPNRFPPKPQPPAQPQTPPTPGHEQETTSP